MLRVTVELIPHGNELLKKTIGEVSIINIGTGTEEKGNYSITITDFDKGKIERGYVYNFPRYKRFWSLIRAVLKEKDK